MRRQTKCICYSIIASLPFLCSCTVSKPNAYPVTDAANPRGAIALYDTHLIDEYLGNIPLELKEENGKVYLKIEGPRTIADTHLYYKWEEAEIRYAPAEGVEYELQFQLYCYLIPHQTPGKRRVERLDLLAKQYKSTIRFKKMCGDLLLKPEITHDAFKGESIRRIDILGETSFWKGNIEAELRPL